MDRRKIAKFISWILLLFNLLAATIIVSMGLSREYYVELSESVSGQAAPLFGSLFANLLITTIFAIIIIIFAIVSSVKEFRLGSIRYRIAFNFLSLTIHLFLLGFLFSVIYAKGQ